MTSYEALYQYFSSFGLPAYEENQLLDGRNAPELPYITYSVQSGCWADGELMLSINIRYKNTADWLSVYETLTFISDSLGLCGRVLETDDGGILLTRGSPFSKNTSDSHDKRIRCVTVKIGAEFICG